MEEQLQASETQLQTTNYKLQTPSVGIIMGSDSDLPIMQAAADILKYFDIEFELTVVSAHRTPQRMFDYASSAHVRGLKVIIAGLASLTSYPGSTPSKRFKPERLASPRQSPQSHT